MVLAFENQRTSSEKLYMNYQIYSYKLKDECDYEYDSQNILFGLKNYYFSIVPEYWNGFNYANKRYVNLLNDYQSLASCIDDCKRIYTDTDMQIIINLMIKYDVNH